MTFTPAPHLPLSIRGQSWHLAEHPAAPGIAYGQEGRAGTVFKLLPSPLPPTAAPSSPSPLPGGEGKGAGGWGEGRALKVFRARFRLPSLVTLAEKLKPFASLPGLQACERIVLTPSQDRDLLSQYPELTYAVLMPWIEGPTWQEVVLERKPLPKEQSLALARALAETLTALEERGLAHGDLSGPNVMLPVLADGGPQTVDRPSSTVHGQPSAVELIDLEGLYTPGLDKPAALTSGSMGYAHREASGGLWGPQADRFAGAVLLAEMLGWCDPQVVQAAWGESYFDPAEMQQEGERYRLLSESLRRTWGDSLAALFQRAWQSDSLADCPTFGEWLVALPERPPVGQAFSLSLSTPGPAAEAAPPAPFSQEPPAAAEEGVRAEIRAFLQAARRMEEKNDLQSAETLYLQALELARSDPSAAEIAKEIELTLGEVQRARSAVQIADRRPQTTAPTAVSGPSSAAVLDRPAAPARRRGWLWALGILLLMGTLAGLAFWQQQQEQAHATAAAQARGTATARAQSTATAQAWLSVPVLDIDNVAQIQLSQTVYAHNDWISAIDFSRDGAFVASSAWDGIVKVWRVQYGRLYRYLTLSHGGQVESVVFSPDGQLLASSGCEVMFSSQNPCTQGMIYLWSFPDGTIVKTIRAHSSVVGDIAFSPDGQILASGGDDNIVRLWRVSDGTLLCTLEGHNDRVQNVTFSPDGQILASGSGDGTVRLWRVSNCSLLKTLEGHTEEVHSIIFSPDGFLLAGVGRANFPALIAWRVQTGEQVYQRGEHVFSAASVAFSPDGSLLATGGGHADKVIQVRRSSDGEPLIALRGHESWVADLAFSPDGKLLISGGGDGTIKVWGIP